ncbi:unnamed protein product [Bursaphelenchus xylophilus]|uniref:(pine wood nematode) hypothetical protein n=1 Tax=Bursaphelenchus xylophilus TaxID=6326 RepID=A0A811M634_BURXY|nr:unnamed protein product [Bursaphelenchus xylophilus]CAG9130860.1 unnamed protein product [Bursaphelenchus xylophilus]
MESIDGRQSEDQNSRFQRFSVASQKLRQFQQAIAQTSDIDLADVLKESINHLVATDAYGTRDEALDSARQRCKKLFKSDLLGSVKRYGEREFCRKANVDITKDLGSQNAFFNLVSNYEPEYLRLAIEVLLDTQFESLAHFRREFRNVAKKRLFTSPKIVANPKLAIGTVTKIYSEDGKNVAYIHFLVLSCQLIVLMEQLVIERVILNITAMFSNKSAFSSTADIIRELSKNFIPGSILLPKFFENVGFRYGFEQTELHTYNYHVDDLFANLSNGIILSRLVENIHFSKTGKLKPIGGISPEDDRLRKISNIRNAIAYAMEVGLIPEDAKFNAAAVHAGEKKEILKLLCLLFDVERNEETVRRTYNNTFVDWSMIRNNRSHATLTNPSRDANILTSTPMCPKQRSPLEPLDLNESEIPSFRNRPDELQLRKKVHEQTQTSFDGDESRNTTVRKIEVDENTRWSNNFEEVNETIILRAKTVITQECQTSCEAPKEMFVKEGAPYEDDATPQNAVNVTLSEKFSVGIEGSYQRYNAPTLADELNEYVESDATIHAQNNSDEEKGEVLQESPRSTAGRSAENFEKIQPVCEEPVGQIDVEIRSINQEKPLSQSIETPTTVEEDSDRGNDEILEGCVNPHQLSYVEEPLTDEDSAGDDNENKDDPDFSAEVSKYLNQSVNESLILDASPKTELIEESAGIQNTYKRDFFNLPILKEENSNELMEHDLPEVSKRISDQFNLNTDSSISDHSFRIDTLEKKEEQKLEADGQSLNNQSDENSQKYNVQEANQDDEFKESNTTEAERSVDSCRLLTFNEKTEKDESNRNMSDDKAHEGSRYFSAIGSTLLNEINSEFKKVDPSSSEKSTASTSAARTLNLFGDEETEVFKGNGMQERRQRILDFDDEGEDEASPLNTDAREFEMRMASNNRLAADALLSMMKKNMPDKKNKPEYSKEQATMIIQAWWRGVQYRRSNLELLDSLRERIKAAKERRHGQYDFQNHRSMNLQTRVTKYIPMLVSSSLYERVVAASFMNRIIEDYPSIIDVFVERNGVTALVESSNLLIRSAADIVVQTQLSLLVNNIVTKSEIGKIEGDVVGLTNLLVKHLKKYRPHSSVVDREVGEIFKNTAGSLFLLAGSSAAIEVMRDQKIKYYIEKVMNIRFPHDDFSMSRFQLRQVLKKIDNSIN